MSGTDSTPIVWRPQAGPQHALVDCPYPEILFGGARGGGKTDGVLGKFALKEIRYGRGFNAVFFRREMPQADDLIERAKEIYLPTGAEWREQSKQFLMPNGGRIRFRPLENTADAQKYQGQNLSDAAVEEAGNYPASAPIDMLFGALRSKLGVPVQMILTANPGGPGQQWIKARYVDPSPMGMAPIARVRVDGTPLKHRAMFIPSRLQNNRLLLLSDPGYEDRLHLSGSPELVRAWLDGDWNVVAGAFFPEFSLSRHVIPPRELPARWLRFRSFDWGSAKPFSVGWWAVSDGELAAFPRGALIRYREWYGMRPGQPNVGLKMTAEEVADGIKERTPAEEKISYSVADPSIFAEDGGPAISERMMRRGVVWRPADNKRVPQAGAMGGWDQLRQRLKGDDDGKSMLLMFSTCRDMIRTLPALQHDDTRAEDVDTDAEDHAADECFVASTLIRTEAGQASIASIRVGDMVATRYGMCPASAVFSVGEREVFSVLLSSGNTLMGTANHPIWVEGRGFIPLGELSYGDIMWPCPLQSSATQSKSFAAGVITNAASTFSGMAKGCTVSCGRLITAAFRAGRISTIATWMLQTTTLTTSFAFAPMSTWPSTGDYARGSLRLIWKNMLGRVRLSGMGLLKVLSGISSTMSATVEPRSSPQRSSSLVTSAQGRSWGAHLPDSALTYASRHTGDLPMPTTLSASVSDATSRSSLTNSRVSDTARSLAAHPKAMKGWFKNIRAAIAGMGSKRQISEPSGVLTVVGGPMLAGSQRVYNLSVEGAEEYFANGVLVHNCRYACMSRPWVPTVKKSGPQPANDYGRGRSASAAVGGWKTA